MCNCARNSSVSTPHPPHPHPQKEPPLRRPPPSSSDVNNLSDEQYCCVWAVEVYEDGFRPEVARTLLARIARHVNPILRARGWRVKRLMESASSRFAGLCTGNGRGDADAASTNIQLNLRTQPSKFCKTFRSFRSILAVMLHEITHTSIGLEDIHPPEFYELLKEIKGQYHELLGAGMVAKETDTYGTEAAYTTHDGRVTTVGEAARDVVGGSAGSGGGGLPIEEFNCGVKKKRRGRGQRKRNRGSGSSGSGSAVAKKKQKRRPRGRGQKMIDGRTKAGKSTKEEQDHFTPGQLAARAALARFGGGSGSGGGGSSSSSYSSSSSSNGTNAVVILISSSDDNEDSDAFEEDGEDVIVPHPSSCKCRSCDWSKLFD